MLKTQIRCKQKINKILANFIIQGEKKINIIKIGHLEKYICKILANFIIFFNLLFEIWYSFQYNIENCHTF